MSSLLSSPSGQVGKDEPLLVVILTEDLVVTQVETVSNTEPKQEKNLTGDVRMTGDEVRHV